MFSLKEKLKNFPTVNYISLYESNDRREYMESQFKRYGIKSNVYLTERYTEIKDNFVINGQYVKDVEVQIGTVISHLNNLKNWYTSCNEPYAIFCEDDISFESIEYWNFTWDEFMNHLPQEWECVQLIRMESPLNDEAISRLKLIPFWGRWWGSHALMKRSYVKKLLDAYCVGYNKYQLEVMGDMYMPLTENILFLGLGTCINVPLLTEWSEFRDLIYDSEKNKISIDDQAISSNIIRNLWRTEGANVTIGELLKL
jgi:hypothetical protein